MTKSERLAKLRAALAYEEQPGQHTFHWCECGEYRARGELCAVCLRREITRLEAQQK